MNRVTQPWYDGEEWRHVRDQVLARHPAVLTHISVWRTRVSRLPAGVETSASLLEALTSPPHTALSLATAVNRFLNHVSHIGMNMWGVTKLHEAAERLSVPEWIVHLRHETTHGHMPEVTMLRAALDYGLAWLDLHYWNSSEAGSKLEDESQDEESELQKLLECYMYLKLYQVWGTERMSELRSQEDVWKHLQELWKSVRNPGSARLRDLTVKAAVGVVKTEVCSWVDREEDGAEQLADILVQEDLLVPDTEFLESFDDWSRDESREVEVPGQLVTIWADFINLVDRQTGARRLVDRLLARISESEEAGDDNNPELAAAWVVILAQAMLGHASGNTCLTINPARVDTTCLEAWLQCPSHLLAQMTGLLCRVAGLEDSATVESLVSLASGGKLEAKTMVQAKIFTEMDLIRDKLDSVGEKQSEGWVLAKDYDWDNVPMGKILGSGTDWSSLWLENVQWSNPSKDEEKERDEDECVVPTFEIAPVDWSTALGFKVNDSNIRSDREKSGGGGGDESVPHFYQDTNYAEKHEIDMFRRRKRLKKM